MTFSNLLMKTSSRNTAQASNILLLHIPNRQGHIIRGKPPGVARTLEQRLRDENVVDPEVAQRINIGFPHMKPSRSEQLKTRLDHLKTQRASTELEQRARSGKLLIDLEAVAREHVKTAGQFELRTIADHYGIFEHLYGTAYFVPRVPLNIRYAHSDNDRFSIVHNGNIIKPSEARNAPEISFDGTIDPITGKSASGDNYWTLLATNPDAHYNDETSECLHWFIGNIPNGNIAGGEILADYLPPFPPKGIGYQRIIFVLYKQEKKMDFSQYKINDYKNLELRTFRTLDFYRRHQDELTPAGLAFFQSNWDESLTQFYHTILEIKEPSYEYDFPQPYLADQKFFPLKQPFNLYMDKHRDSKQLNKEYLERKLSKTHPFDGPEKPLSYPNAHPIRGVPSWLRTEIRKQRLNRGRVQDY